MKKRVAAGILGVAVCMSLFAGTGLVYAAEQEPGADGKDTEQTTQAASTDQPAGDEREWDTTPLTEEKVEYADCVVLPDYSKYEFTKSIEKVTDESLDSYIAAYIDPEELTDENATVEKGDKVNIAYDGVTIGESPTEMTRLIKAVHGTVQATNGGAGSGMSSSGYDLTIGSGVFIDGYEDGLIGMKKGQKKMLILTFPEDYGNEELNGQDVVFMTTVNTISRAPEPTDEWVKDFTRDKYDNVEDYKAATREKLETDNANSAETALQTEIWNKIMENAEFKYLPADIVEYQANEYEANVRQAAEDYGIDIKSLLEEEGKDMTYFDKLKEDYGRSMAKSTVLLEALAKDVGIEKDSKEYEAGLQKLLDKNGVDLEAMQQQFSDEQIEKSALTMAVMDKIIADLGIKDEYVEPEV